MVAARPLTDEQKRLVGENIRLAYQFANRFHARYRMHLDDVLSAAQLGLMRAVRTWDPRKARLSTHAFRWMQNAVQEERRSLAPMVLPAWVSEGKPAKTEETEQAATLARAVRRLALDPVRDAAKTPADPDPTTQAVREAVDALSPEAREIIGRHIMGNDSVRALRLTMRISDDKITRIRRESLASLRAALEPLREGESNRQKKLTA